MPDHARIMGPRPTRIPGLQLFQELARRVHTPLPSVEPQILGGGVGRGGGGSERQMTNEQRRMNNDLGCRGRTGGSHRRAGRARYKARQGEFFFFCLRLNDVLLCGLVDDGKKEGRSLFPELRVYM